MKSIKLRLITYFTLIILISSASIGVLSIGSASKVIREEAESALGALAFEGARLVESKLEMQKQILKAISLGENIQSMDWELQRPELIRQAGQMGFVGIGVGDLDGVTTGLDGSQVELGDRPYVKNALAETSGTMDLTLNRSTNELSLLNAVPIKKDDKIIGFLNGRSDGNALSEIVDETGFGEKGYGYVINGEGTVIAHPNRELVLNQYNAITMVDEDKSLESLAALTERILEEKSGVSNYSYSGNELYAGYEPIGGTDWTLVIVADKGEVLYAIPVMRNSVVALVLVALLIAIAVTYMIGHLIAQPIIVATNHSESLANFDITEDIPKVLLVRQLLMILLQLSYSLVLLLLLVLPIQNNQHLYC